MIGRIRTILVLVVLAVVAVGLARASYFPFTDTGHQTNIGIGTNTPQAAFVVTSGNVGIGTWAAGGGSLVINGGGNVGIGTAWPGATLDVNGSIRASSVQTVNIGSTPYTIAANQNGVYFRYTNAAAGAINLPAIAGLNDGFTVTILRQVPKSLTITANGTDGFPGTPSGVQGTLEMQGQNMASITLKKSGSSWKIASKTDDCIIGQACWYANMIYAGTLNGHQYFTTPGGCNDYAQPGSPTCAGTDSVTKAYADNATGATKEYGQQGNATDEYYGGTQTATLANNFTDTLAAKFCKNMTYDGNNDNDWYLPAKMELNLLYQNKVAIGGFYTVNTGIYYYWSSTEYSTTNAWDFYSNGYMSYNLKLNTYYVRCVRRY